MAESLPQLAHDFIRPLLVGELLTSTMTGAVLLQMVIYFVRYQKDPIWLKCLVVLTGAISCLTVAFGFAIVYTRAILQSGDPNLMSSCMPVMTALMVLPPVQSAIVQLFFSWRASHFIKSRAFFIGTVVSAMLQVGCIVASILVATFWPNWQRGSKINPTCLIWNCLACATDILVSGILIYHLRRRRTGHPESDQMLSSVTRLTFESGALTASWAVASLVLFVASKDAISVLLIMAQPPLYANNLLAALNCRLPREKSENDSENPGTSVPGSPEKKSRMPVSEVTLMSLGLKSEPIAAELDQRTADMETSFGMSDTIYADIRHSTTP